MKTLLIGYTNSIHFWRWASFLNKANIKVSILSFVKNTIKFKRMHENYIDYSIPGKGIIKILKILINIFKCISFINNSNFDLINFSYFELYSAFIMLLVKKRIMITCWGSDILLNYKNACGIKKIILNMALKKAEIITCDSNSIKNLIIKKNNKINKEKIHLIYWGIDTKLFSIPNIKEKNQLREKYDIPKKAIVLLSIRNLTKQYNILKIIKSFKNNIADKNIFLLIKLTKESNKNYLIKCIKQAGNNKNIIFINKIIDHSKINEIYKLSDISLHFPESDSTPVSMLEGISSGNIIICSNCVDSYKKLSDYYNINLLNINYLNNKIIYKIIKNKNNIILENKNILKKIHSEEKTIKDIKSLFNN